MKLYKAINNNELEKWVKEDLAIPFVQEFYVTPSQALENRILSDNIVLEVNHHPKFFAKIDDHYESVDVAPLDSTIYSHIFSPGEALRHYQSNVDIGPRY